MKAFGLLAAESARLLGFDWIAQAVAPVSPYGVRLFAEIAPFRPGSEAAAQERAERIAALARRFEPDRVSAFRAALEAVPDVQGAVARASMGEVLDDPDFLELLRFCEIADRVEVSNDATRAIAAALGSGKSQSAEFYLADTFDATLAASRVALAQAQAEFEAVRGREFQELARGLGREEIAGDEFVLMRTDIPAAMPSGVRVVREAPAYLLCALAYGEASLAALERRDAASDAVANAEESVRARLSSVVGDRSRELNAAASALGELDVTLGAVAFSQRYNCTIPTVTADPMLACRNGRFLPMEAELAAAGRGFVPIDLDLAGAAVLTGPNMGGKTVTLQTCGFLAVLAAFGLPVPAQHARVGLFDEVAWLGVGQDERAGGLLSSFAHELVSLKTTFSRDAPRLLLLADEFARTTTPHEGRALVIALLERVRARDGCALAATHLQGIAGAAGVKHFAVRGLGAMPRLPETCDLTEALAQLAAAMDYRVVEVAGDDLPQADAIALAELLGLDRAFVEAARRALSE